MKFSKQYIKIVIYVVMLSLIYLLQSKPVFIENYYLPWFYNPLSVYLRQITSFFSFSIGDLFYILLGIWIVYSLVKLIFQLQKEKNKRTLLAKFLMNVLFFFSTIFIVFKLFWGTNYNRLGVTKQFSLKKEGYCKEQLNVFIDDLIYETNKTRALIEDTSLPKISIDKSFNLAVNAYKNMATTISFLQYKVPSIKPSLFSKLGDYTGFIGYFNPFSGEAQLRNDIPEILIPYVATHEIAHQLGYASESEASFIGFLVCNTSDNKYLQYSLQLDLLALALNELPSKYLQDGCSDEIMPRMFQIYDCLSEQVKKDKREIRFFFEKKRNSVVAVSNMVYDNYLKFNNQFTGIDSYNEVLDWILVYKYQKK